MVSRCATADRERSITEQAVLETVVNQHLPELDETFLAALGVYAQMADARKDEELKGAARKGHYAAVRALPQPFKGSLRLHSVEGNGSFA